MKVTQFDHVSVVKLANIYFAGKCVSHTVLFSDGSRKTVGIIFPGQLSFNTAGPEKMEITAGTCRVSLADSGKWQKYTVGESFRVAANSSFVIETTDTLQYVCHFGRSRTSLCSAT
jgi:uncharacterized protein YaiE (UPF0345 family)